MALQAESADAPGSLPSTLGYDGTDFYGFLEYFRNSHSSDGSQLANQQVNTAGHGLFKAHLFSLQARMAVYFAGLHSVGISQNRAVAHRRHSFWSMDFSELSFHLPFHSAQEKRGAVPEQGLHAGWHYPVAGNPDAVIFGNYMTRFGAYPFHERYPLALWDSLGAIQPRVSGLGMAWGRKEGLVRLTWDLTYLDMWFYLQAEVSGRLGRAVHWGVGLYQSHIYTTLSNIFWEPSQNQSSYYGQDSSQLLESDISASQMADSLTDSSYFTFKSISPSARLSLDIAALLTGVNKQGDKGNRYGILFAEAAVIGWKNQPYYYADRMERLIWTAGTHLPTWGFLDQATFQVEWMRSPTDPSGFEKNYTRELPIPGGLVSPQPRQAFVDSLIGPQLSPWKIGLYLADEIFPHFVGQFQAVFFEEREFDRVKKRYQAQVRAAVRF